MRAQKRDANEPEIIAALEAAGCTVDQLPGGSGRPDLLVGDPQTRLPLLMEVKMPLKATLNPLQKKYHAWSGAKIYLVTTPGVAIEIINHHRKEYRK